MYRSALGYESLQVQAQAQSMVANVGKNKERGLHGGAGSEDFSPAPEDTLAPIRGLPLATNLMLILISFTQY